MKIEYIKTKDKDFIGKRFKSWTIEKRITYDNGEVEHFYRVVFPHIDGDIEKIDLDKLYFPKTMTNEEWENMPPKEKYNWLGLKVENNKHLLDECNTKEILDIEKTETQLFNKLEKVKSVVGRTIQNQI